MLAALPTTVPTVADVERALRAEFGPYHVGPTYYANPSDADRARRLEAERRVRDAQRRAAWLAEHECRWCGRHIGAGEAFALIASEPIHVERCAAALDEMLYGTEVAA